MANFSDLQKEEHLQLLTEMYLIRYFEEAAGQFYRKGLVKGGIHASIGQEAVAVGVCANLNSNDLITSTHRGHGHHIAKGADIKKLMAEILGKESGYCKGRGGSMHVAAFDVGSLGAFPIVAGGVPSAVGAGLSAVLHGSDSIVVSFFGDGALGQGTVYECFNLAAIWKLPLIFVCENNQYAVSTRSDSVLALKDFSTLAETHGLIALKVNGQNLNEVYDCMVQAKKLLEEKENPIFIQAETYRFEGHYFGEPEVNRDKELLKKVRAMEDPIDHFQQWLTGHYGEDLKEELKVCQLKARKEIDLACQYAVNEKEPAADTAKEYVYA